MEAKDGDATLHLSLLVDIPRLVARTKRRDREEKTSVGFCDPYAYTAAGLMGYFLSQLRPKAAGRGTVRVEVELVSYLLVAPGEGAIMAAPEGAMAPLVDGSERARRCGISLAIEPQSFSDKSRDGDPKGLLTARARREKKKHGRRRVGLR